MSLARYYVLHIDTVSCESIFCREQLIMVPDITGGALCPRLLDTPLSRPSSPSSSSSPHIIPEKEEEEGGLPELKHNDEVVAEGEGPEEPLSAEMSERPPSDPSGPPPERLSLPSSSQTEGKLANRDSGIDSISSPSHSEELCFVGVDDGGGGGGVYSCGLPRLSSSSSYAGEGEEGEARGTARRRDFSEDADSDLEEEEEEELAELTLVLSAPRQDLAEVRQEAVIDEQAQETSRTSSVIRFPNIKMDCYNTLAHPWSLLQDTETHRSRVY